MSIFYKILCTYADKVNDAPSERLRFQDRFFDVEPGKYSTGNGGISIRRPCSWRRRESTYLRPSLDKQRFEQGRYVRAMFVAAVAERIGVDPGTSAGKAAVCAAFQDLIKTCSWSSFVVRSPSFTAEGLRILQKSQREQVWIRALLLHFHQERVLGTVQDYRRRAKVERSREELVCRSR